MIGGTPPDTRATVETLEAGSVDVVSMIAPSLVQGESRQILGIAGEDSTVHGHCEGCSYCCGVHCVDPSCGRRGSIASLGWVRLLTNLRYPKHAGHRQGSYACCGCASTKDGMPAHGSASREQGQAEMRIFALAWFWTAGFAMKRANCLSVSRELICR